MKQLIKFDIVFDRIVIQYKLLINFLKLVILKKVCLRVTTVVNSLRLNINFIKIRNWTLHCPFHTSPSNLLPLNIILDIQINTYIWNLTLTLNDKEKYSCQSLSSSEWSRRLSSYNLCINNDHKCNIQKYTFFYVYTESKSVINLFQL